MNHLSRAAGLAAIAFAATALAGCYPPPPPPPPVAAAPPYSAPPVAMTPVPTTPPTAPSYGPKLGSGTSATSAAYPGAQGYAQMPAGTMQPMAAAPAPLYGAPTQTAMVAPYPPPAPQVEMQPPGSSPMMVWDPGHWWWNGQQYSWMPGHYVQRTSPTAQWVPGHWQQGSNGWMWVDGHWAS